MTPAIQILLFRLLAAHLAALPPGSGRKRSRLKLAFGLQAAALQFGEGTSCYAARSEDWRRQRLVRFGDVSRLNVMFGLSFARSDQTPHSSIATGLCLKRPAACSGDDPGLPIGWVCACARAEVLSSAEALPKAAPCLNANGMRRGEQ